MADFDLALDEQELNRKRRFVNRHRKCYREQAMQSAIGGHVVYDVSPTSIGTFIVAKCLICKKEKEISDSNSF